MRPDDASRARNQRMSIAIPWPRHREVTPETRARCWRHHMRQAGSSALGEAFADVPRPRRFWPLVLRAVESAAIAIVLAGGGTLIAIGFFGEWLG